MRSHYWSSVDRTEYCRTVSAINGPRISKIFGGILYRRENNEDIEEKEKYEIPSIDLVIVDLYPFEETVKKGGTQDEIIEKIDIGGIALIRAAAKNHKNVVCISSVHD